jgi:hypothetical protein
MRDLAIVDQPNVNAKASTPGSSSLSSVIGKSRTRLPVA